MKKVYDSKTGYNLWASRYDEDQLYLSSFEKEVGLRMLRDVKGKRVLDLGCGTGRTINDLKYLGAGEITGLDLSEEMLNKAQRKFRDVEFVEGDAQKLPFEDESFDYVTAMFVIVHLKSLERIFEEVYRILKDEGVFVLSNVNQRKAPKLKLKKEKGASEEFVISSFYHRPEDVIIAAKEAFFDIEKEEFVYDGKVWINQIIKLRK